MPATPTVGDARAVRLADHTTVRVGGPAASFALCDTEQELIASVRAADERDEPVLVLGGGSNVVVSDDGFPGAVARVAHTGISLRRDGDRVVMRVAAGERWDDVVVAALAEGLAGIECLSGIPGLAGATPIQNVGAYGAEISDVVSGVRAFDRLERATVLLDPSSCRFGYRTSALKGNARYLVLGVEISLARSKQSAPVRYAELAAALDVQLNSRAAAGDVRRAVLGLRGRKGMLVDPDDPDSVSVGSFFTNPVLPASAVPAGAPSWPIASGPDGVVKVPAAWLIEQAGFHRGFGEGHVGLSSKHTLAIVNRGGATSSELVAFARAIRDGVQAKFGIRLEPEPVLVGLTL
ncbi:MAG TPA: UDP-N-acetylmuramate dehydrogenase [Acidothermaceae bacterium]